MTKYFMPSPTPDIWLQDNEAHGAADCGCRLASDHDGTPGAAFTYCAEHRRRWNTHDDLVAELQEHVKGLEVMGDVLTPWATERLAKGRAALALSRQT